MLPTHVTRAGTTHEAPSAAEQSASYPPAPPSASDADMRAVGVTAVRRKAGVQEALFGPRGAAALTVDSDALDKQDDALRQARTTSHDASASAARGGRLPDGTRPPRWSTWEFRFYALVFAVMVPYMVWVPIQLSSSKERNFLQYSQHLAWGWIFGRLRDDSDFQYRSFRDYVPLLAVFLVLSVGAGRISERQLSGGSDSRGSYAQVADGAASTASSPARPGRRPFLMGWTIIFILALHGANTLKLLVCCCINYLIAKSLKATPIASPAIWTFNVVTLFAVHYYEGVDLRVALPPLGFLEQYKGLLTRWQINYNITMLRLVSFALDYHWAALTGSSAAAARPSTPEASSSPRQRTGTSHPLSEYTFLNYLLYSLYPPLFIAGPIMTFNDFLAQLKQPLRIPHRVVLGYAVRFGICMLTMEFITHYMYVMAIKDARAWKGDSPLQLSMIGFWNLIIVWLKLLLPWRFFRLWAMADGVDAPENMIRCMANNYSTLGFWRSWHRSYNLWIVRYIYVPVGGARRAVPATFLVFTFVAFWHDLSLKLLTWGWLVSLFILPEVACRTIFTEKKYGHHGWYRHLCAMGGVFNVLMMMTANLVGFVIGVDGIKYMWQQILGSTEGLRFLAGACATLFVGVQVMFEYREEELRRGISRKC